MNSNWKIWNNSKQWVSTQFIRIFPKNSPKNETMIKAQQFETEVEKDHKKLDFMTKFRGRNIEGKLNKKLQKINRFFEKNQSEQKPLELACPICIDLYNLPVTTVCGHTFCLQCLDQSLLFTPTCPVCRTNIRGAKLFKCQNLSDITLRYASKCCTTSQCQDYMKNLHKALQWQRNRNINGGQIKINQALDVRDTQFIWCSATVKEVYMKNGVIHSILVHYRGWNNFYDEVIEIESQRIVSHQFYTIRKDIPRYRMDSNNEESMHNFVIMGPQPIIENFTYQFFNNQDYIQEEELPEIDMNQLIHFPNLPIDLQQQQVSYNQEPLNVEESQQMQGQQQQIRDDSALDLDFEIDFDIDFNQVEQNPELIDENGYSLLK